MTAAIHLCSVMRSFAYFGPATENEAVSTRLRSLHDETPDPLHLSSVGFLHQSRQTLRLGAPGPDRRQVNPRIGRYVADGLCVACDHEVPRTVLRAGSWR